MTDLHSADGDPLPGELTSPSEQRHLHRLARLLVRNEHDADDVVQDAWLAALRAPTDHVRNWSAWLKSAVRRGAHHRRRRVDDQRDVERRASRGEAVFEDSVRERIDSFRLLEDAVRQLDEPYRVVIEMRFFGDHTHQEISEVLRRPLETVRSQVKRGLAKLRARLDDEHDGRRALWAGPLAAAVALEGTGRGVRRLGVAAALLFGIGILGWWGGNHGDRGHADREAEVVAVADPNGPVVSEVSEPAGSRTSVEIGDARPHGAGSSSTDLGAGPGPRVASAELRILDPRGRAVPGARVHVWDGTREFRAATESDPFGIARFHVGESILGPIDSIERGLVFAAYGEDHAWSLDYSIPMEVGTTIKKDVVLGSHPHRLTVSVRDVDERPIASASLWVLPVHVESRTDTDGTLVRHRRHLAATDEGGIATFEGLGTGGHRLTVAAEGFVAIHDQVDLETFDTAHGVRLLRGAAVEGSLRLPNGEIPRGARVWVTRPLGENRLKTWVEEDGSFELQGVPTGPRYLKALGPRGYGASLRIDPVAHDVQRWDAVLEPIPTLCVRVETADGGPAPTGAAAVLVAKVGGETWMVRQLLDAEGSAVFRQLPEEPVDLAIFTPEASQLRRVAAQLSNVREQEEPLVIRLEPLHAKSPACVFAHLETHDAELPRGASIELWNTETTQLVTGAFGESTGDLNLCEVPPGTYRSIVVWAKRGVLDLGVHTLTEGGEFELGNLRLPAPRTIEVSDDPRPQGLGRLEVLLDGLPPIVIETQGQPSETERLPGSYRWVSEDGIQRVEFELR